MDIKETKEITDELEKKNIPYLFFNIDLNGFNNISFIGQDSYLGGYVAGKLMHLSLHDETSFLVVQTRLNVTNYHHISKRIEGFNDYFIKNDFQVETQTLKIDNLKDIKKAKQKLNSYLTFKLGNETFAANVANVLHILGIPEITKMPNSPDYVLGVMNLRGQVLPVIDPHPRFKIEAQEIFQNTELAEAGKIFVIK